jgi:N-dimethylarginine dimethylaminohydrolase
MPRRDEVLCAESPTNSIPGNLSALNGVPIYRHRDDLSSSVPCLQSRSSLLFQQMAKHVLQRVLLCPPAYFDVVDQKNPYMSETTRVDRAKAQQQWQTLRSALERTGCQVETIAPVPGLEDMVFAANQVFVGAGALHPRFVVPSRMRHVSRRREVPYFVEWFARNGFEIVDAGLEGEFLEGHGDLLAHPKRNVVWAGHGFRSSPEGVARFARAVHGEGLEVEPLRLVDPVFYHLDTCFAPLNEDAAIVYPGALAAESLDALRRGWKRLHEIGRDDALEFACNGVAVGGHFIVSHITPALRRILDREALTALLVDTSEFEKAGGSVFCLKALLL